jgi:hypothetical protein
MLFMTVLHDGGRSSVGRAPGCDPGCRGFESHRSPQSKLMIWSRIANKITLQGSAAIE